MLRRERFDSVEQDFYEALYTQVLPYNRAPQTICICIQHHGGVNIKKNLSRPDRFDSVAQDSYNRRSALRRAELLCLFCSQFAYTELVVTSCACHCVQTQQFLGYVAAGHAAGQRNPVGIPSCSLPPAFPPCCPAEPGAVLGLCGGRHAAEQVSGQL